MVAVTLHTQRATDRRILDCGLDYILTVKGYQPTPQARMRDDFHRAAPEHSEDRLGHGRIECRTIRVSLKLDLESSRLPFAVVRFASRLTREMIDSMLTSLTPKLATPVRLRIWSRCYSTIENCVNRVHETVLDEDAR